MSEENNKKNDKSVSYTKAGLLEKSDDDSKDASEKGIDKQRKETLSENTPKISKEESTSHNNDRPLH